MFFHFTGIKDISDKNYTLDLLIEAEDISIVKAFLASQKVVTLGLEVFEGDVAGFWKTFFSLFYQEKKLNFFSQFEDLEELIKYLLQLGTDISEANYIWENKLSDPEAQAVLSQLKSQHEEEAQKLKAEKEKADQSLGTKFFDKRLQKAQEAIEEIINQIDQVLEIGREKISPSLRKSLDDARGNISKLRLATNYDNIVEELHSAMDLIVTSQDFLLERLEEHKIFSIIKGSEITNVDVIGEQTKMAKARLLQTLWASLSKEEAMYASLGYLKIFSQYLYRDISVALENKVLFVQQLFKGMEVLSLFVLLWIAILAVFAPVLWIELSLERFGIMFMYVAVFAIIIWWYNYLVKPQTLLSYGIGWLAILTLYGISMYGFSILLLF